MTKRKRKRVYKRSYLGTIGKQIRSFLNWLGDGIKNFLLLLFGIMLLGNLIDVNIFGLVTKKIIQQIDTTRPLKENEDRRVTFDSRYKRVIEQEKGKKTVVHEGVRKAEYTQLDNGKIERKVKNKGLSLEPGLVLGAGDGLRLGVDVQYAYWKRWGLGLGATIPPVDRQLSNLRGHASVIYSPRLKIAPGTSFFGGLDTNKSPIMGIRTEF